MPFSRKTVLQIMVSSPLHNPSSNNPRLITKVRARYTFQTQSRGKPKTRTMRKIFCQPHSWRVLPLLLSTLPLTTSAEELLVREEAVAPSVRQPQHIRPNPHALEEIPDDIWSTIASPFDPIQTAPNYPASIMERMPPPPHMVAPAPVPAFIPPAVRAVQAVHEAAVPPQPPTHYPAQPTPLPISIPHELPQQEKVVSDYPEEYWNCLLNNLQGVGSDVAAKLITRACQKRHPKQ
jgi:hypothetical protein